MGSDTRAGQGAYMPGTGEPAVDETRDGRRSAPAALRNRDPIRAVLARCLPASGTVLEIAAGTGEHAVHFARHVPHLAWQPTDPDAGMRASIAAHTRAEGLTNVAPPLDLPVEAGTWPVARTDAVVAINLLHIASWSATQGLFAGCARVLSDGAPIALYGPFMRDGAHTADSNARFDTQLRARDAAWGIRDVDDVAAEAGRHGITLIEIVEMPANNLMLLLRR